MWGGLSEATPCIFLPMVAVVPFLALLLTANPAAAQASKTFAQVAREADASRSSDQGQRAIDLYREGLKLRPAWSEGWAGTSELIDVAMFHFGLLLARDGRFIEALYLLTTEVQRRGRSPALAEAMGLASLRMRSLPGDYPAEQREIVWLAGNSAVY